MCDRSRRLLFTIVAFVASVLALRPAHAGDVWSRPYDGVKLLHRTDGGTDVHIVLVDLSNPRVSIVATKPEDRFITTSAFAHRYGAQVAINANFYNRGSCGLMVGDGAVMNSYEDACTASVAFGDENQSAAFDSTSIPHGPVPEAWMRQVLTGKPFLIHNGRPMTNWSRPQHLYRPNPRTALGVTRDRATLVLLVADGRRKGVQGVTGFEMVRMLLEFNVTDAINLDGGGSSALVVGGQMRNHVSDPRERSVVSHLGVRIGKSAPPWTAGEIVGTSGESKLARGTTADVWVEARNTGRAVWWPAVDRAKATHEAPRFVVNYGAQTLSAGVSSVTKPGEVGRFLVRVPARDAGTFPLGGEVIFPQNTRTAIREGALQLTVSEPPARPAPPTPARNQASAPPSAMNVPAPLGTVFAGAHGPWLRAGRHHPRASIVLGLSLLALAGGWMWRARRRASR